MVTFHIALDERAILFKDGRPLRFLGPGTFAYAGLFATYSVARFAMSEPAVSLEPALRALVPEVELLHVEVLAHQRALVWRHGRPVRVLASGVYDVWTYGAARVELIDASGVACEPLVGEARPLLTASKAYVETVVPEGAVGLRYVDGVLDAVLRPGKHAAWTVVREVVFVSIDLRERIAAVTGQEVMTKDKVSLRVNVSVTYRVGDARLMATAVKDAEAALHLAAQLLLRDAVAAHTVDELLAQRDLLVGISGPLTARMAAIGLAVSDVGVKDLILPGEMRTLMNRVIEAQKAAEANVITRREETAAARSLAQTAKVLAEHPLVMRLKELEAMSELAGKVGTLNVVMGQETLGKLELKV